MTKLDIIPNIQECLDENDNKLSSEYINSLIDAAEVIYLHPTPTMRICVITLQSGHEVYGVSQVLDPANDVEAIGKAIAYKNASEELWRTIGSIAKALI